MNKLETVSLTRRYPIRADRLYDVLTTPHYMEQWFSPAPEIKLTVQKHSREVGAPYEFAYMQPDGSKHIVVGEYCALDRPSLVAFTWGWREPDPDAGVETLVTLTLEADGAETELTVLHERLHEGVMADRHNAGWAGTLDHLSDLVRVITEAEHV